MDQSQDFKSLQGQVQAALISTTRTAGQISSEDLGFQRSLNPEVGAALDEQSGRLLTLSASLLKSAASIAELRAPVLEDSDDVENKWRSVVDVIDSLLEKTDTCLDEYTGMIKRKDQPNPDMVASKDKKSSAALSNAFRTQNLVKPQLAFDTKPDNHEDSKWLPLLTSKPHASIPLEESLSTVTNEFGLPTCTHPYATEIMRLQYPDTVYQKADPIPYKPMDTTSATFVDTEQGVLEMLDELKRASEIAIDLEHHDARSYVGLVSLMQISTRDKDWIVDTLKPWRQKLQVLNEVFADPTIVKVFHGAFMDIIWLQRDLGLYVVGLFDTHCASRTLGYAGGSLAFLLKKFIDFDADKKYQMADWRIRPLPEEMFYYARSDTHFLLYIYDNMRNELIERSNSEIPDENRMELALQKSKDVSLLRYDRQVYNAESGRGPGGWYSLLVKTPALFNNEQFAVFRAVHEWRDNIARTDDDSSGFVMPNHVLFSIGKLMPTDMVALLKTAHPVSHGVKSRLGELLDLIKAAKARGRDGPSMIDVLRPDSLGAAAKTALPPVAGNPRGVPEPLVAAVEIRSNNSTFWGGAFGSSIWDESSITKNEDDLRLAVALPPLSSEVFTASNGSALDNPLLKEEPILMLPVQPSKSANDDDDDDDPFVLKHGKKRKSDAVEELEEPVGDYDISLNDLEEPQERLTKGQAKARRKAARKAKQEAKKAGNLPMNGNHPLEEDSKPDDDEDYEPFDYSKAESVLHSKQKGNEVVRNKQQKPFDPYTKSANAPKGMRRTQTQRAGKSHTFKS